MIMTNYEFILNANERLNKQYEWMAPSPSTVTRARVLALPTELMA